MKFLHTPFSSTLAMPERGRQGGHLQVCLAEGEAAAQTDGVLLPELTLLARGGPEAIAQVFY